MGRLRVSVSFSVEEWRVLNDFCVQLNVRRARFLHDSFVAYASKAPSDVDVKHVVLVKELEQLFREEKRLRCLNDKILSNHAYLRQYAKRLMLGGFEDSAVKYRPPLTVAPNAAEIIQAFEGIFSHRQKLGQRMAEIARELYPGEYGLQSLPSSDQNKLNTPVNNVREGRRSEL